ncbi:MAG: hypothetical protein ACRDKS_10535, partial [Actinomycetota bacterium]
GRPAPVFSLMTGCVVGDDEKDLSRRAKMLMERSGGTGDPDAWLKGLPDVIVSGTVDEAAGKLGVFADAGVDRLMMQMQSHDDVEMVHVLGKVARLVA